MIQVLDKQFKFFLSEQQILTEVKRVATEIRRDLQGKDPVFISVLNGAFMFTSDLMKELDMPCQVSFVKLASYASTASTGTVKRLLGINSDIKGRCVVIVEDIIDTGYTMEAMIQMLKEYEPAEIRIAALLLKPDNLKIKLDVDYVALRIPNDFIVGYGLDYDGYGRNYRDIYVIDNSQTEQTC